MKTVATFIKKKGIPPLIKDFHLDIWETPCTMWRAREIRIPPSHTHPLTYTEHEVKSSKC